MPAPLPTFRMSTSFHVARCREAAERGNTRMLAVYLRAALQEAAL